MPPKKKGRAAESIHTDLVAAFDAVRPQLLLSPDSLPQDLVARAYGQAGPRDKGQGPSTFNRQCPPRWQAGTDNAAAAAGPSRNGSAAPANRDSTEVLVLDTASEESNGEEVVTTTTKGKGKAKAKAKGKGKAVSVEPKEKPCSPENCANNPNCVNWLGQEKWEDSSEYIESLRCRSSP